MIINLKSILMMIQNGKFKNYTELIKNKNKLVIWYSHRGIRIYCRQEIQLNQNLKKIKMDKKVKLKLIIY